jgi:phosphatidylglycerophosphatase A
MSDSSAQNNSPIKSFNYYYLLTTGFGLGFLTKVNRFILSAIAVLPFYMWLQFQNKPQGFCLILFVLIMTHRGISKFMEQLEKNHLNSILSNTMLGLLLASYEIPCSFNWFILTCFIYWVLYNAKPLPIPFFMEHTPENSAFVHLNRDLITGIYSWAILHLFLSLSS